MNPDQPQPLRILGLQAKNFKRLVAVDLHPDGKTVIIGGRNAQGKSSILDAITTALGGAKHKVAAALRTGERRGHVRVDLGEIVVTRKWTENSDTLTVEAADGTAIKKQQGFLDSLFSSLSFDPLSFSRMKDKEQADTLRALVPALDTSKLDGERAVLYAKRTEIGRELTTATALLDQAETPPGDPGPPIEVPNVTDLMALRDKHRAGLAEVDEAAVDAGDEAKMADVRFKDAQDAYAEAERMLEEARVVLKAALDDQTSAHAALREINESAQVKREEHSTALAFIADQLASASAAAAKEAERHAQAMRRTEALARIQKYRAQVDALTASRDALTDQIREIDDRKTNLLAAAELPVAGLGLSGDQVMLNGIPYSDASQAEQIKAGVAIAGALNPTIRVMMVKEGSLLDDESFAQLNAYAAERGLQLWCEVVGTDRATVVVEDGSIVGAEPESE